MIESNIFSSSPWNTDSVLSKDLFPTIGGALFDIEVGQNCEAVNILDEATEISPSPVHSLSSGGSDECDWMSFDDINSILPVPDTLVSEIFEDENIVDSLHLNDLDWESLSSNTTNEAVFTDSGSDSISNVSNYSRRKRKQKRSPECLWSSKSWSRMTCEEQLKTVNTLSEIVSHQMGLREQIEVIKLIDPNVTLSPNAKEFTINLSQLSDFKLKRIKDYIKKHVTFLSVNESRSRNSTGKSGSSCHSVKRRQKKEQLPLQKEPYLKELKERKLKVLRQDKKEKQSGLFVREKKIKRLSNPHEEDEYVNVLE